MWIDYRIISIPEIDYEASLLTDKQWRDSEHFIPVKCMGCSTVYNYMDHDLDECPFCRKLSIVEFT